MTHRLTDVGSLFVIMVKPDLGAVNVSIDTLAGVTLLLPPAAVRKLQAGVMTRPPLSDDWREEKRD